MTTFFDFRPSATAPFQFQPTLDGQAYSCSVTWNLFGRRYYLNCFSLGGVPIFSVPLTGSPPGIELQSLSWDANVATARTIVPHGLRLGTTAMITISGSAPDAFNGTFEVLATDSDAFTWDLSGDPGPATAFGAAFLNQNLAGGYFVSSLVWRPASSQFEVTP